MDEILKILGPREFERLVSVSIRRRYKKKESLCEIGDIPTEIGFVESGLFRIFYNDDQGREFDKRFCQEGDLVGACSDLISGTESKVEIEALEDSSVLYMDYSQFKELCKINIAWSSLNVAFLEKQLIERDYREFELLSMNGTKRYESFKRRRGDLLERLPQYLIASHLGMTPVSLSRIAGKKS